MSNNQEKIIINSQPIALCQLLKVANLVSGGGEAKIVISQGYVKVNGEEEYQKRKKIVDGDIIEFNGEHYCVQFDPYLIANNSENKAKDAQSKAQKKSHKNKTHSTNKQLNTENYQVSAAKKRKPISF
jgi:ribosome-associated protein